MVDYMGYFVVHIKYILLLYHVKSVARWCAHMQEIEMWVTLTGYLVRRHMIAYLFSVIQCYVAVHF